MGWRHLCLALATGCGRIGFGALDPSTGATDGATADGDNALTGLVAWWKLDDGSGTTAVDSSGTGNDSTLQNGPMWTIGMRDGALQFDGSTQYLVVNGSNTGLDFERTDPVSVSAWLYPTTAMTTWNSFVDKFDPTPYVGYWLAVPGGDAVSFSEDGVAGDELQVVTAAGSLPNAVWHHVAVTYDGSSTPAGVHIYIDAISQTLTTNTNTLASSIRNTTPLRIGAYPPGGNFFHGSLDDVRIYSRELTVGEVQQIFNAP